MKDKFQSKAVPRGTRTIWRYLSALFLLLTLGVSTMWADTELCSATLNGITANANTTGVAQTGCTMKWNNVDASSNKVTVGGVTYYKFSGSGSYVQLILNDDAEFQAGDILTVEVTSNGSNKSVLYAVHADGGNKPSAQTVSNTATVAISYTLVAADIESDGSIKIFRGGNTNVRLGNFSVVRPGSGSADPISVTSITITPSPVNVKVGKTKTLKATVTPNDATDKAVTWAVTSGGTYASVVEATGVITGLAVGTATITATAHDGSGVTQSVTVNVEECPTSGTVYKFQLKTGLTNGNLATSVPTDIEMTTENYLSDLIGGTLTVAARNNVNRVNISNGNAIGFANGDNAFLKMDLDCAIQAGDILKYDITSNDMILMAGSETEATNRMTLSRNVTQVEVDSKLVGASALYMKRSSSSPKISYFEILRPVYHTITLNYADGVTADGSIPALDGAPATKPADPTKDHFRFDGWYNGADAYDWSANVTGDLTLTAHWTQLYTVSFQAGEGSGDAPAAVADKAEGETFEVPANTFTAPASKEFDKWNDGTNDYAPGATYTVGTANVVLTAQWKAAVAKYSVIFKDGETELGTKLFDIGSNPSDADIDKTKPLFAFAAWQKEGSDIALDDASWASLAANAEVTLTARWDKVYASSVDLEGLVESEGVTADWQAYLSSHGYAFSTSGVSLDAKNPDKTYANWPYQGLKAKALGAYVEGNIEANKLVIIKLGHMAAAANVTIGGVAAGTATGLDAAEPEGQLNYFYVENESVLHYETTNAGACVLKAITITNPFQVTFNPNGGDPVAVQYGHPSVTLPSASNGTKSLLGWFDAAEGGNKIGNVGDSYTPTATIELFAQWEDISSDNTLSDLKVGGVTVDGFDPAVHTYYVVLPYGTEVEDIPAISATANSDKAKQVAIEQAVWTGDPYNCYRAQANVQAEDESWGYYDVRFSFAPKDGVSIIKVATTGGTNKTVTGLYAGDGDVNLSSSTKMDNGKFIGFTLDGTTLQAGDQINVHTTQAANTGGSHIIFYDNMTDKNELYETGEIGGEGDNIFTINAAMEGHVSAYVYRSNADAAHQWNGYVDFIEVTRPMNPVLTAISIDGRDGELDMSAANHFNVLIPYESDLANLTIVPEIVWNAPAADNSIVVNDGGAWILGDNTYKLTDKDGDFTVYTIKLTRDVLKHTVSFNTHGGPAIDPVLVVDGHSLTADQVPADPEKEDYLFQGWAEAEDGAIVDVTSFTISADKEFHAVWAPDGAIKLIVDGENPGEKVINHINFITGAAMASSKVTVEEIEYNYAQLGGTASTPSGQNQLNKFITYNATTTQTKVMVNVYNNSTNARQVIIKGVVEGSIEVVDLATINLDNGDNKHVKSAYYEFNNAANRTIYISVPNTVASIDFLQVKVIESGEPLKMFGENGYSINLNKGRLYGPSATDLEFEGMTYNLGSNYNALSSTVAVFKKNTSYQIDVPAAVTMTLTTSASKFYVSQAADGTDNETAADGAHDFDLTAGTWFINVAGSNLNVTNIAFSAPKCEKPAFTSLANSELCEGDAFAALDGSATVSDGGTVSYQWYNEDDSAIEGAINATFTPSADGKYYVIATNSLADHADNFNKSDLVTVAHLAGTIITSAPVSVRDDADVEATLTVVAEGKNLAYKWYTCDEDGSNAVLIPGAESASYSVTITADMAQFFMVEVSGDCGAPVSAIAKVEEWKELDQVDVSENTIWNMANAAGAAINLASLEPSRQNEHLLLANVKGVNNNETFNAQALMFEGQHIGRTSNGVKHIAGRYLQFNVTIPGIVKVTFASNGGNQRTIRINGNKCSETTNDGAYISFSAVVNPGSVEIMGMQGDAENQYIRISKIEFMKVDYTREVNSGRYGTICLPNSGKMYGASLFEIAYYDANAKKIFFDEILDGEMVAGMPYIFLPNSGVDLLAVAYTDEANADALSHNGLVGFIGSGEEDAMDVPVGAYILKDNQYRLVEELGSAKIRGYRSYIDLGEVPASAPAPAPGRRRISMGVQGAQVATAIDNAETSEAPLKLMINGQLFIIRGEKMFDATGRLVK